MRKFIRYPKRKKSTVMCTEYDSTMLNYPDDKDYAQWTVDDYFIWLYRRYGDQGAEYMYDTSLPACCRRYTYDDLKNMYHSWLYHHG